MIMKSSMWVKLTLASSSMIIFSFRVIFQKKGKGRHSGYRGQAFGAILSAVHRIW